MYLFVTAGICVVGALGDHSRTPAGQSVIFRLGRAVHVPSFSKRTAMWCLYIWKTSIMTGKRHKVPEQAVVFSRVASLTCLLWGQLLPGDIFCRSATSSEQLCPISCWPHVWSHSCNNPKLCPPYSFLTAPNHALSARSNSLTWCVCPSKAVQSESSTGREMMSPVKIWPTDGCKKPTDPSWQPWSNSNQAGTVLLQRSFSWDSWLQAWWEAEEFPMGLKVFSTLQTFLT